MKRLLVFLVLLAGCQARVMEQSKPIVQDNSKYVLMILLDMSGSFQQFMAEDGKAYEFSLQVVDRYFRDRINSPDRLVIAQISANDKVLLWEGTPMQLRQDFPSASAFRQFLIEKSDPYGSIVHYGVGKAVRYIRSDPEVISGQAKSAIFVLSDMQDTTGNDDSMERMMGEIRHYGDIGGVMGFYYLDQNIVYEYRMQLASSGLAEYIVEADIVGRPTLPEIP